MFFPHRRRTALVVGSSAVLFAALAFAADDDADTVIGGPTVAPEGLVATPDEPMATKTSSELPPRTATTTVRRASTTTDTTTTDESTTSISTTSASSTTAPSSPATTSSTTAAQSRSRRADGAPVIARGRVTNVVDGDTVDLADGTRVRIAIVDTPETHGGIEPCGPEAAQFTSDTVAGREVVVYRPTSAPQTDPHGRTLGEVVRVDDGVSLNVELVAAGWGEVNERYADEDPDLAHRLRARAVPFRCTGQNTTTTTSATTTSSPPGDNRYRHPRFAGYRCDDSYANVCIPSPQDWGDDIDCPQRGSTDPNRLPEDEHFRNIVVRGSDPHRFDGSDNDGLGCEAW